MHGNLDFARQNKQTELFCQKNQVRVNHINKLVVTILRDKVTFTDERKRDLKV